MTRFVVVVAGLTVALGLAGPADARSFTLLQSDVRAEIGTSGNPPGLVRVEERITVAFSGAYTFGFRDIPLRDGETIGGIAVVENGRA
jgi:hypothetical protein